MLFKNTQVNSEFNLKICILFVLSGHTCEPALRVSSFLHYHVDSFKVGSILKFVLLCSMTPLAVPYHLPKTRSCNLPFFSFINWLLAYNSIIVLGYTLDYHLKSFFYPSRLQLYLQRRCKITLTITGCVLLLSDFFQTTYFLELVRKQTKPLPKPQKQISYYDDQCNVVNVCS